MVAAPPHPSASVCRPSGPAGQAAPEHYRAGPVAPTSGECPPHRRCADLPLSGDAPARPLGWEPGNRLCAPLPRYSERPSRRTCGRVHTMRTISPWQSAAHDPAGDGIRNAGGRGTRRLPAGWCFTGLRDPRAPPRGASPAQRAIDDSPTFRSAALPSSSCPPCLPGRGPPEGARLAPRVSGRQRRSERRGTRSRPYRPVTSGPSCRWREGVRRAG
jgi:hypothetical protein